MNEEVTQCSCGALYYGSTCWKCWGWELRGEDGSAISINVVLGRNEEKTVEYRKGASNNVHIVNVVAGSNSKLTVRNK